MNFDPIDELIKALQKGEMVIMADDESRENEGDLIVAAEFLTPDIMNFMIQKGSGIVCLILSQAWADRLDLSPMVEHNTSHRGTNFTVSIEAAQGVSTGVSAADRVQTIRAAIHPQACASDLLRPGHVFPIVAHPGGLDARQGHTEASLALMTLAGLRPQAVIVEIMNPDGNMARRDDLLIFKEKHGLKMGTVAALIEYMRGK